MLTALGLRLRLRVFLALAVSAGVCFAATPAVGRMARRIGAMDRPGESRRVHDHPIPRLGGLAILLGLLAGVVLFAPLDRGTRGILWGCLVLTFQTGHSLMTVFPMSSSTGELSISQI